jgi:AraC-like DNA-binding protein
MGNCQANRYLGLFTFLIAITVLDTAIDSSDTSQGVLFIRTLVYPRDYLFVPALYFYIREMTLPGKYSLIPRQWLHFLPALCHIAISWLIPILNPALHQAILINNTAVASAIKELTGATSSFEIMSSILQISLYLWLSVRVLYSHRERAQATLSYEQKINLNWLQNLLYGVAAVYVIWIFEELFDFFDDWLELGSTFFDLLCISLIILLYTMSYLGLRQPIIFSRRAASLVISDEDSTNHPSEKYITSSLSSDLSQKLVDELQQLMNSERPYLNSQLSLPQLADQLGVSAHYLSQIINEQLDENFFDLVNHYRINQATVLLQDANHQKTIF